MTDAPSDTDFHHKRSDVEKLQADLVKMGFSGAKGPLAVDGFYLRKDGKESETVHATNAFEHSPQFTAYTKAHKGFDANKFADVAAAAAWAAKKDTGKSDSDTERGAARPHEDDAKKGSKGAKTTAEDDHPDFTKMSTEQLNAYLARHKSKAGDATIHEGKAINTHALANAMTKLTIAQVPSYKGYEGAITPFIEKKLNAVKDKDKNLSADALAHRYGTTPDVIGHMVKEGQKENPDFSFVPKKVWSALKAEREKYQQQEQGAGAPNSGLHNVIMMNGVPMHVGR